MLSRPSWLVLMVALILLLGVSFSFAQLRVHFIDVGQGDSILLETEEARILVDAGQGNAARNYLLSLGIDQLDLVVGTHAHADHIGGFPSIFEAISVDEVWYNGQAHTTVTFERFIDAILASDARYHEPVRGEVRAFGGLTLKVLHPTTSAADYEGHLHDMNIVIRAVYGEFAVMLTGDAEAPVELELIGTGLPLASQVLKMGHHGSRTSSTLPFVRAVAPAVAVYQAGSNNRYGHPHEEALINVAAVGADIYGNDVHGTIVITAQRDGRFEIRSEHRGGARAEPRVQDGPPASRFTAGCVNINTDSEFELTGIIHIDEVRAREIVRLREERPFESVEELTRVRGIAAGRLADIVAQGLACLE